MIKKYKLLNHVDEVYHDSTDDTLFIIINALIFENKEWKVIKKIQFLEERHD